MVSPYLYLFAGARAKLAKMPPPRAAGDAASFEGVTAIYGGSFNPPHLGHQMAILYVLEALAAEAVWLVPARVHPFGKALAPYEHRVEMCRLLAQPFGRRVEVSMLEGQPEMSGKTYDTLMRLKADHPKRRFALVIGSDVLGEAAAWHRWSDIVAGFPLAVVGRSGYAAPESPVMLPAVSSSDVRARILAGQGARGLVPASVAEYIERHRLYRE